MKRLLVILALLLPLPAMAQQMPTVFKIASGTQFNGLGPTATQITTVIRDGIRAVRIVCTVACFYAERLTNTSILATTVTGVHLPANVYEYIAVSPGSRISAIASTATASGNFYVVELTR